MAASLMTMSLMTVSLIAAHLIAAHLMSHAFATLVSAATRVVGRGV